MVLLRADEVAMRWRISRAQVYAMAKEGRLPCVKFGDRAIRFPEDQVEQWLEGQIQPTAKDGQE